MITFKILFTCALIAATANTQAQKNIILSDSLAANAEQLDIGMDKHPLFKAWKFQVGKYAVVGKTGWGSSTSTANLWGTQSETNEKESFSFVMHTADNETATVEAANYTVAKESHSIRLFSNFYWGNNKIDTWSQRFTAFITLNKDTSERWVLVMSGQLASDTGITRQEAYLFRDSSRKILLVPVTSNKNNEDKRMVPAYGYELLEDDQPIGAIQYYGGGLLGWKRSIVWMDKRPDNKTRLIMAATMASVYQFKVWMRD